MSYRFAFCINKLDRIILSATIYSPFPFIKEVIFVMKRFLIYTEDRIAFIKTQLDEGCITLTEGNVNNVELVKFVLSKSI
jgi:hypothetical protein